MPYFAKSKHTVESLNFEKYDVCLLFFADQKVTDRLLMFAKKSQSCKKPFFFVRSKIDAELRPPKKGVKLNEDEIVERTRKKVFDDVKKRMTAEHEIFLLSNDHPEKWDFVKLVKAVANALPDPQKRRNSREASVWAHLRHDSLQCLAQWPWNELANKRLTKLKSRGTNRVWNLCSAHTKRARPQFHALNKI